MKSQQNLDLGSNFAYSPVSEKRCITQSPAWNEAKRKADEAYRKWIEATKAYNAAVAQCGGKHTPPRSN